jgi:hypothetical protein
MKYLIILSFIFFSCTNKNIDYSNVIDHNNESLKNDIEVLKHKIKIQNLENPSLYSKPNYNLIIKISNDILNFKDVKNYSKLYSQLENINNSQQINDVLLKIESDEHAILYNNLLLNLSKLTKAFIIKYNRGVSSTNCIFGDLVKYEIETNTDSVVVNFNTRNPYDIVIDSIVENKNSIDFVNRTNNTIGQLKYKKTVTSPKIYGKIFCRSDDGESILVQKINQ